MASASLPLIPRVVTTPAPPYSGGPARDLHPVPFYSDFIGTSAISYAIVGRTALKISLLIMVIDKLGFLTHIKRHLPIRESASVVRSAPFIN